MHLKQMKVKEPLAIIMAVMLIFGTLPTVFAEAPAETDALPDRESGTAENKKGGAGEWYGPMQETEGEKQKIEFRI